jgi:hypothetical protein
VPSRRRSRGVVMWDMGCVFLWCGGVVAAG